MARLVMKEQACRALLIMANGPRCEISFNLLCSEMWWSKDPTRGDKTWRVLDYLKYREMVENTKYGLWTLTERGRIAAAILIGQESRRAKRSA